MWVMVLSFLGPLWTRFRNYIVIAAAVVVAIGTAYLRGRSGANADNRERTLRSDREARQQGEEVRQRIDATPDSDVHERVQSRWTRRS